MAPASSSHGTRPGDTFHVEITVRYQGLKATQYFSKFGPESNDVFRNDLLTLKMPLPKVENTNLITHGSVGCFWPDCIRNSTLHKHIIGKANHTQPERVKEWQDALAALSISSFLVKEKRNSASSLRVKLKRPNPFPEDDGPRKMMKSVAIDAPPQWPQARPAGARIIAAPTKAVPDLPDRALNVSRAYRDGEEPGKQAQNWPGALTQPAALPAEPSASRPRTRFGPALVIKSEPIDVDLPPAPVVDTSIPDVKPAWNGATPVWPRAVRDRDLQFQGMATRSRTHPQPSTLAANPSPHTRGVDLSTLPYDGVALSGYVTEPRPQTRLSTFLTNGNAKPSARVLKMPNDPMAHEPPTILPLPKGILVRPPDSALRKSSTIGGLPTPPTSLNRTQFLPNPPIKTEPLTIRIPARPRPSATKETQSASMAPTVVTAKPPSPPSPPPPSYPVSAGQTKQPTQSRPQKGIPLSQAAKDAHVIQRLNRELWEVRRQAVASAAREETIIKDLKAVNAVFIPETVKVAEHDEVVALKARVARLEEELKAEQTLRREAEGAIEDIRRECRTPFVVPSLVDAFVQISKLSTRSIQLSMEEKESAMDVSPPDVAIPVT